MALEDELREELEQAFNAATNSVRLNTPKPHVLWWPNGHPTFIAVPEDRSYGHNEAQRDGQTVADFTLAGDKWAALFALVIKRMPTILAALTERKAPVEVEGLVERPSEQDVKTMLARKWLDPECLHDGCQSLVWKRKFERCDAERDKFMWQVRDTCTRAEKAEAELATLKQQLAEREEAGWLPIETAPKDGRRILVWATTKPPHYEDQAYIQTVLHGEHVEGVQPACWLEDVGEWELHYIGTPLFWRPLPDAPALTDKGPEQKDGEG